MFDLPKKILKKFNPVPHLQKYPLGYLLLFSIFLLGFSSLSIDCGFWIFSSKLINNLLSTIALAALSSVVFNVIIKSEQFSEIFKKELRDIVYFDENLENRKNLDEIWEKTTKALCNQKFKNISHELHNKIKNHYLPYKYEFYYKDSKLEIHIELDNKNEDYLFVTETFKTTLISHHEEEIIYKFSNEMPIAESETNSKTYFKLNSLKIDGKLINHSNILNVKNDINKKGVKCIVSSLEYPLSGKNTYEITRTEEKHYNLNANNLREHLSVWLYENLEVSVIYPPSLDISHKNIGIVPDSWVIDEHKNYSKNKTTKKFSASIKSLIFEKQGFLLLLNKNKI